LQVPSDLLILTQKEKSQIGARSTENFHKREDLIESHKEGEAGEGKVKRTRPRLVVEIPYMK
jgi:hypothetical protein